MSYDVRRALARSLGHLLSAACVLCVARWDRHSLRLDGGDSHAYTAGATAFWILIGTIAAGAFGCTTAIYVDSGMFSHQMKVLVTCFWSLLHLGGAISAVVAYAVLFFTKDMFKEEIQGKKRMPSVSYYVVVVACAVAALAAAFTLLHMYAIKTAETVSPGKDARSSEMDDDE